MKLLIVKMSGGWRLIVKQRELPLFVTTKNPARCCFSISFIECYAHFSFAQLIKYNGKIWKIVDDTSNEIKNVTKFLLLCDSEKSQVKEFFLERFKINERIFRLQKKLQIFSCFALLLKRESILIQCCKFCILIMIVDV